MNPANLSPAPSSPATCAEWSPSPASEREIARDRRRERRRRANGWFLALSLVGGCPFGCVAGFVFPIEHPESAVPFFLALGSVGLLFVAAFRVAGDKEAERRRRAALRQEFGGIGGWLVEMTVRQGEALSGRDVGLVWFEGDRLYFTGLRTSFGLGFDDTQGRTLSGYEALDHIPHLTIPLRAKTHAGAVAVGLRFLWNEAREGDWTSAEQAFREAIWDWFRQAGSEPGGSKSGGSEPGVSGRGQLPPLAPGADLPSPASLRRRAALATAIWPTLAVLLAVANAAGMERAILLFGLSLPLFCLWHPAVSPRACWRAVRDRRALDATIEG